GRPARARPRTSGSSRGSGRSRRRSSGRDGASADGGAEPGAIVFRRRAVRKRPGPAGTRAWSAAGRVQALLPEVGLQPRGFAEDPDQLVEAVVAGVAAAEVVQPRVGGGAGLLERL